MPLQKLPVHSLDDINHRRRARETINNVLDHSFDDSRRTTDEEKLGGITPINPAFVPGDVRRFGAPTDGVASASAGVAKAASIGGKIRIAGTATYLIDANVGIAVDDTHVVGDLRDSTVLLSGNSRRAFAVTANNTTFESLYVDGQKPTVGWETTNNFDFGIRVGEGVSAQLEGFRASGHTMKDLGLDGIYLGNVNNAIIENCEFVNCRRTGIAIVSGDYGTTNITVRNCRFFCDFSGGPTGKERPLFAIDVEPDSTNVDAENIVLENLFVHEGRLSMVGTPPATVIGGVIRNCDIVGANGNIAIDACDPEVSDVNLLDGAYAYIDNVGDAYPARPYITRFRSFGRTQEFNADGRANLLPRDCFCSADGTASISGSGTITQEYYNLDGVPSTVSAFRLGASTGVASATVNTSMGIASGDNVWVLLEVERSDGNVALNSVYKVTLGSTIDRTYGIVNGRQWIVIAVQATATDNNPTFRFGLSGTPSANVTIRCYRCFVYINPAIVDMPTMKVGKSSASKTFTSWAGTTLDAYNLEMCALDAGSARNLDAINGATDQVVSVQSVGSASITIRDTGTSGVGAGSGGIKLSGGGTATLTSATFRRHSDGFWYRV